MDGLQLSNMIRDQYQLSDQDPITTKQLNYVLGMLKPTNYLLQHHTINGNPLTFRVPNKDMTRALNHRDWQIDMVNDMSKDVVFIKGRQMGMSELGIEQAIWFADIHSYDKVNVLYAFPTYKQMNTFYKQRLKPEFETGGYYSGLVDLKHGMSMEQIKIRDSTITFRTSSQGSSMEGLKTDLVSLDEYDRLDPLAEQSAIQSMSSSQYQLLRRWSTPTSPHYGIHKLFEQSDQRLWTHKCPHCGYEQVLDYEKNIKLVNKDGIDLIGKRVAEGTYMYVCQKCGKPLDRWYDGFWDITAPGDGSRSHGYSISQMDCVWISASNLKEVEMNAPSKSFFYNYSLGRPYQDKSLSFSTEDVLSNIKDYDRPYDRSNYVLVASGVDWG